MAGSRAPSLSVHAVDAHLTGTLQTAGDLHLDGIVNGEVMARAVTVGQNATVIGTIEAEEVSVAGTVHGAIRATRLTLSRTARVHAEVTADVLTVDPGAVLERL